MTFDDYAKTNPIHPGDYHQEREIAQKVWTDAQAALLDGERVTLHRGAPIGTRWTECDGFVFGIDCDRYSDLEHRTALLLPQDETEGK